MTERIPVIPASPAAICRAASPTGRFGATTPTHPIVSGEPAESHPWQLTRVNRSQPSPFPFVCISCTLAASCPTSGPRNLHARPPPPRPPPLPYSRPTSLRCPLPTPLPPQPPLTAPTFLADPSKNPSERSRGSPIRPSPPLASRVPDSARERPPQPQESSGSDPYARNPATSRILAHPPATPQLQVPDQ